jgi:predicted RNase H-like HicB family nuclease
MAHIVVTIRLSKSPGETEYVSECLELGISSCGVTIDEALAMAEEAVSLYIETLADEGELDRLLADRGILVEAEPFSDTEAGVAIRVPIDSVVSRRAVPVPSPAAA